MKNELLKGTQVSEVPTQELPYLVVAGDIGVDVEGNVYSAVRSNEKTGWVLIFKTEDPEGFINYLFKARSAWLAANS